MTLYMYIYMYVRPLPDAYRQTTQPPNHPQPIDIPNGPLARSGPIRPNNYTRTIRAAIRAVALENGPQLGPGEVPPTDNTNSTDVTLDTFVFTTT
jgi:hypothetical protein